MRTRNHAPRDGAESTWEVRGGDVGAAPPAARERAALTYVLAHDFPAPVTELPGYPHPRRRVDAPSLSPERAPRRPARGGRLPAGQVLVSVESIRMPQSMHAVEARRPGLVLVDALLLRVVAPRRDQRAAPGEAPRLVEELTLFVLQHRDLPRAAALGGGRLHRDAVAAVGVRRRELDRLLPAQAERRLQTQRQIHVRVLHQRQLPAIEVAALRAVGDVAARKDAVVGVRPHHVALADPVRPPAQVRHAVHHGGVGQAAVEPAAHQRVDVLDPQAPGAQAAVARLVQRVGHPRQRVGPVAPRGVRAAAAGAPLQLEQIPVQVAHARPIP